MPLISALSAAWPKFPLVGVMVGINCIAGAVALALVYQTAKALGLTQRASLVALAGACFSHAIWIQATDAETYGLALVGVMTAFFGAARYQSSARPGWAAVMALGCALAGLMHVATAPVVLVPALMIVLSTSIPIGDRLRHLTVYAVLLGALAFGTIAFAAFGVHGLKSLGEVVRWLTGWKEDIPSMLDVLAVPRAAYGFVRSFVFLEYFWEAPRWVIATKAGLFGVVVAAAAYGAYRSRDSWWPSNRRFWFAVAPFVALQVATGVLHYGSDTERWVFLVPLVWLLLSPAVDRPGGWPAALAVLTSLAFINTWQFSLPSARDVSTREKIAALYNVAPRDTVIVGPGLDWTQYIEFYTGIRPAIITFENVMREKKRNHATFYAELDRRMADAKARKATVIMIRILDPEENLRNNPWQGLVDWGYSIADLQAWARKYRWREERLADPDRTRIFRLVD
jgi:hypothetical protein